MSENETSRDPWARELAAQVRERRAAADLATKRLIAENEAIHRDAPELWAEIRERTMQCMRAFNAALGTEAELQWCAQDEDEAAISDRSGRRLVHGSHSAEGHRINLFIGARAGRSLNFTARVEGGRVGFVERMEGPMTATQIAEAFVSEAARLI